MLAAKLASPVQELIARLESEKPTKASEIVSILKDADLAADDLADYADFDHDPADSYGRKMVYKGANYEIMVMSWPRGDFSAIHDHGHTVWGAVKIFGRAEHAVFRWEDEHLSTLARWQTDVGDVLGVGHSLIHQMGNKDQPPFISLHVYGCPTPQENITGEARIFDLKNEKIQRVNGGAFFNIPKSGLVKLEEGPRADFPTQLRFILESFKRASKADSAQAEDFYKEAFSLEQRDRLLSHLQNITNPENGKAESSIQWRILNHELKEAAEIQAQIGAVQDEEDSFHKYAEVYDHVIGQASYDSFMESYLDFFVENYAYDFAKAETLSVGCGTGLIEEKIIQRYGGGADSLYGIDVSESMISEARKRIRADVGDLLTLDPRVKKWDMAFSGLNVYQYLPHNRLEESIRKTAAILREGGVFLGDFITPDHIRWYPNVMYSKDQRVVSLRTPELIEEDGVPYQRSEIVNISFLSGQMNVHYAGRHLRHLPPVFRIRSYFEKYFRSGVDLYDAVHLTPIKETDDSCKSTRYIVVARV